MHNEITLHQLMCGNQVCTNVSHADAEYCSIDYHPFHAQLSKIQLYLLLT